MQQIGRPPERKRIPVVLTVPELQTLRSQMAGTEALLAALLSRPSSRTPGGTVQAGGTASPLDVLTSEQ